MKKLRKITCLMLSLLMILPFMINARSFDDVPEGVWYAKAVDYVTEKAYFSGTGENRFSPLSYTSRAMLVTVLAAVSGIEIDSYDGTIFKDVPANKWYMHSVGWAYENGITSGTGDGCFSPDVLVTRQEACTMIIKLVKHMHFALKGGETSVFEDDSTLAKWAKESVYEANSYGIISGKKGNICDPKGLATRAELAQMIMKLDMAMEDSYSLNCDYVDIKIPNAESVSFLQMSDMHLTLTDDTDTNEAKENQKARGEMFDSEISDGVTREDRFDMFANFCAERKYTSMILTGDIVDAPSNGNIAFFKNHILRDDMQELYVLGNHDWSGDWLGVYHSQEQWDLNVPKFNGIIKESEDEVYEDKIAIREFKGFTVIALDNSDNQVSQAQYTAVRNCILDGTPIILLCHVPIDIPSMRNDVKAKWGSVALMGNDDTGPNYYTKSFVNMLRGADSTVVAIIAGHIHMDHVDKVSENNDTIQYCLGSSYDGAARVFSIHS